MIFKITAFVCLLSTSYSIDVQQRASRIKFRIVNGQNAQEGQFPHIVSFQLNVTDRPGSDPEFPFVPFCAGSILNERWILTAAHCVEIFKNQTREVLDRFIIKAGEHVIRTAEDSEQAVIVESFYIHENYSNIFNLYSFNDIALIKTKAPFKFDNRVDKIDLPEKDNEPDGNVILAGWGTTANSTVASVLQTVTLPLVKRNICNEVIEKSFSHRGLTVEDPVVETNICTGALSGNISACKGDSGGPLISMKQNGKKEIVGIVSWVVQCGTDDPTVYVRVSSFIDWIADIMSKNK